MSRRRRSVWINTPGRAGNWRGPNRALPLDEQLEVQRLMKAARAGRNRAATSRELATRYGVSSRTIWRYAATIAVPGGVENLRIRLNAWAAERGIRLTYDDMAALMLVVARHRDMQPIVQAAVDHETAA